MKVLTFTYADCKASKEADKRAVNSMAAELEKIRSTMEERHEVGISKCIVHTEHAITTRDWKESVPLRNYDAKSSW